MLRHDLDESTAYKNVQLTRRMRVDRCDWSGYKVYPSRGKVYVRGDSKVRIDRARDQSGGDRGGWAHWAQRPGGERRELVHLQLGEGLET